MPDALPAVGEAVKDGLAAVGPRVGPYAAAAVAAAPEMAAGVGLAAAAGGATYLAANGPIGHATVEGYDGSVLGRAPVAAEVDARAGTVTLYRPDAGGAPLTGTGTATLALGADGALRDGSGALVGRRTETGSIALAEGIQPASLMRGTSGSVQPVDVVFNQNTNEAGRLNAAPPDAGDGTQSTTGTASGAEPQVAGTQGNEVAPGTVGGARTMPPVSGATPGRETKGRTTQWEKPGSAAEADADFDAQSPGNVRPLPNGGRVGELPDGRKIIVRPDSSDGRPTLEIQDGPKRIKVRYGP